MEMTHGHDQFLENQETRFLHGAGQKNSEQAWDGLMEASEEISDPSDVSAADEIQAQRKKSGEFTQFQQG